MTDTPGATRPESTTIGAADLEQRIVAALGSESSAARTAASWLLQAEVLGLPAFGIDMLVREFQRLGGAPDPTTALLEEESPVIHAARLPGPLALAFATSRAAERASADGLAMVGLREVGALGMIGSAAHALALEGLIGVVMANSAPFVAPFGGTKAAIGTNPIAVAAPREGRPPLVIDFSTSPTTVAALRAAQNADLPLPAPGGFDASGNETRIAADVSALSPEGRIASLAGLFVEILAGVGIGVDPDSDASGGPGPRSALVLAFSPARFGADDAAAACSRLAERWGAGGGHVPARFDRLQGGALENALLQVHTRSLESLDERAQALTGQRRNEQS